MSKHLERDLANVGRSLGSMSSIVEEMISLACRSVHEHRSDLTNDVFDRELIIDEREVEIEEECLKILALHQPVAIDLRRTVMLLKINSDLERIADLAVNVAERARSLAAEPDFPIPKEIGRMTTIAVSMVGQALDAHMKLDTTLARAICKRDEELDELNRRSIEELVQLIRLEPHRAEEAMNVFSVSRHIERIGDHATNIAEDVIYLVDGEIARHRIDRPSFLSR